MDLIWIAVAIVGGAILASVVAAPRYVGRHRAPGPPNYGNEPGTFREWIRGNPKAEYRTQTGRVLTDDDIEALSDEAVDEPTGWQPRGRETR